MGRAAKPMEEKRANAAARVRNFRARKKQQSIQEACDNQLGPIQSHSSQAHFAPQMETVSAAEGGLIPELPRSPPAAPSAHVPEFPPRDVTAEGAPSTIGLWDLQNYTSQSLDKTQRIDIPETLLSMFDIIGATKVGLLLLLGTGIYSTWYILLNNGTTKYMSHIRDVGPRLLPGTTEPLKTTYTGVRAIDYQFTVLTLFFWEVVDGSHPAASLFGFHFATQVACGWGLLMLEGLRPGHRWTLISFIGTMGILLQNAAYAVIMPIYLLIYLFTSPLLLSKSVSVFSIDRPVAAAVPISIALGYVLPAVLMSLPAPSVITFENKQAFIAIWQVFPLWCAILQEVLPYLWNISSTGRRPLPKKSSASELHTLRSVYAILIATAGIGQVSTFTLIATSRWFPNLFASEFRNVFSLSKVFIPSATSPSTKMPSIGSGAFLLLQYDELVGSASMVLFTTILYLHTLQNSQSCESLGTFTARGIAALLVTGPLGYAVTCIWARDELILSGDKDFRSKKSI